MYDILPLLHINITGGAFPTRIAVEANSEQKQDFQRLLWRVEKEGIKLQMHDKGM